MGPCKKYSDIQVLVIILFPTPPIKRNLGLQVIATHFNQSNYLANQKQAEVNKFDLTAFITLFQASSKALKVEWMFNISSGFTALD
jgi:hypothetical protein